MGSDCGGACTLDNQQQPGDELGFIRELTSRPMFWRLVVSIVFLAAAELAVKWGAEDLWVLPLYLLSALIAGWDIYPRGVRGLIKLRPSILSLMTVAVAGAMFIGAWTEAVVVVVLFEFAEFLESFAVKRANLRLSALLALKPDQARVITPGGEALMVPSAEVSPGTLIQVIAGERIPLDGRVVRGSGLVSEAALTGEAVPREKEPGDQVFAGTTLENGTLWIETTREAGDTKLDQVAKLLMQARKEATTPERVIDGFARWYTPAIMVIALLVAVIPPLLGITPPQLTDLIPQTGNLWVDWGYRALAILVIGCPCALVISAPVAVVSSIADLARKGILIKGGGYLEIISRTRAFAFDKTGTLTTGRFAVEAVETSNGASEEEVLALAMALEEQSTHPLARAILDYGRKRGITPDKVETVETVRGRGVVSRYAEEPVMVGSHRFMHDYDICDPVVHLIAEENESRGEAVVMVARGEQVLGVIRLRDQIRPESAASLRELKELTRAHLVMLTGDHPQAAKLVSQFLPLDEVKAGLLPDEKLQEISRLKEQYGTTAMVGDGINDAPSLAWADLGISMAGIGTDLAVDAAQIALLEDRLDRLPLLVRKSRKMLGVINQNIVASIGLKALFLVLAILGATTMWLAILADVGATILVTGNSLRLYSVRGGLK